MARSSASAQPIGNQDHALQRSVARPLCALFNSPASISGLSDPRTFEAELLPQMLQNSRGKAPSIGSRPRHCLAGGQGDKCRPSHWLAMSPSKSGTKAAGHCLAADYLDSANLSNFPADTLREGRLGRHGDHAHPPWRGSIELHIGLDEALANYGDLSTPLRNPTSGASLRGGGGGERKSAPKAEIGVTSARYKNPNN